VPARGCAPGRQPAGQAVAAAGLSRTYSLAARRLEAAGADRLAGTARRAADAYTRLAAAARSGEVGRWRAAVRGVRRVEAQLGRELRQFAAGPS